jgi:hypothetical protein
MTRKTLITTTLVACFAVCLAAIAGGLAGKWKSSLTDDEGNTIQLHLVLNVVNGEQLTGTAQAEGDPLAINDGKINGDSFSCNVKDPNGNVIPIDGKYIAAGDSVSLNFTENNMKHHATFVRDDK